MLTYFNYFISYSFLGFLIETFFSFIIKGRLESRKCLLFSTLCPVYGLGSIAIIESTKKVKKNKFLTFIIGLIFATLTELVTDIFYKDALGASFWDYSRQPFNLNGSICLKYSIIWGGLSLLLVYIVHPYLEKYISRVPKGATCVFIFVFILDSAVSALLLKKFGNKNAVNLAWIMSHVLKLN